MLTTMVSQNDPSTATEVDSSHAEENESPTVASFFKSDLLIGEAVFDFAVVLIFWKRCALVGVFLGVQRNGKDNKMLAAEGF